MAINPSSNPEAHEEEWEVLPHEEEARQETETESQEDPEAANAGGASVPESVEAPGILDGPRDDGESLILAEEPSATLANSTETGADSVQDEETTPFIAKDSQTHDSAEQPQSHRPSKEPVPDKPSESPSDTPEPSPLSDGLLGSSLRLIGDAVKDLDQKHHIRRKTKNSWKTIREESHRGLQKVGDSAREVSHKIQQEAQQVGDSAREVSRKIQLEAQQASQKIQNEADRLQLEEKAKAVEAQAKMAAGKMADAAKKAAQKAKALNEEHKITDMLAAAAIIGAGVLVAQGNPRAGATVLASGGAAYVAGEAMKAPYRHDEGLNENVGHHL